MFSTSTHLKFWTFAGERELKQLRNDANQKFIETHGNDMSEEERASFFLTPTEERLLIRQYEHVLREFCNQFQPPFPKCIFGTSLAFFKRFWVNNSPMDYHPKDIMLTVVYLACKVEEFYVPIGQFVRNLKGKREKFADTILAFELLVMSKLGYHLTVHNPYRAFEGFLIDIKTRFTELDEAERLRRRAEEYIDHCLMTDIALCFAPSQIALASVLHSATKEGLNLDRYISEVLHESSSKEQISTMIYQLKRIKAMAKKETPIPREQIGPIQAKLEKCRNQENNPDSDVYKAKMTEQMEDDDDQRASKRVRLKEDEKREQKELLGEMSSL